MADAKPLGRFVWFDLMTTDPAVCAGILFAGDGLGDGAVSGAYALHDVDE